jgi:hypothetical protein
MPERTIVFDDGGRITWKDKETLRYEESGYVALVWVDYEPGFFRRGRILRQESLERWNVFPKGAEELISSNKKTKIISRVRQYFGSTPVRIE